MLHAPPPANEERRLAALRSYEVLETLPEPEFDDLTRLAALICGTPMALVTLVDVNRGWFKSRLGIEATETPRTLAFCAHAILSRDLFIVPDAALDERFADNPLVTAGPQWRFYAGVPIITEDGYALGALCAVDTVPHHVTAGQEEALRILGRQVAANLRLRKSHGVLQKLEALRDSLTLMIIHDLRQPLQSLMGGLATLSVLGELNEAQQEFLAMAEAGGETLLGMVNDLLDISKLESGVLELEYETLVPVALVDESLAPMARLAAEKGVTLLPVIEPGLPPVHGDREKLRRALVNVIGNAVKFTPRGGLITVSVRQDEDSGAVLFSVADTGEGIPEEAFGRIFEKFGQLERGKDQPKQGTGLGLTFCKMVVEAHGGSLQVESEPGKGSIFVFVIPTASAVGEEPPVDDPSLSAR